jgi:hypothetical protein
VLWDPVRLIISVFRHLVAPFVRSVLAVQPSPVRVAMPANVYLSMQSAKKDVLNN